MKKFSRSFHALWTGEMISEFGGAAGGIINGLLLFELTGSKEWMGALWLVYFIPSLVLQGISAPYLNQVNKERALKIIQLIRMGGYLLPLAGWLFQSHTGMICGLVILQCCLGLLQPVYASLSFSILPELCEERELAEANGLLDGTMKIMSFLAPGAVSLLLLVFPLPVLYAFSSALFFLSFVALYAIQTHSVTKTAIWTKKFWWSEMQAGYRSFFQQPQLLKLTLLSSSVQFAVGASLVLSVPFIRGELGGERWEYAVFSGAFPVGYTIGSLFLSRLPKNPVVMYSGLAGGGLSFLLLYIVDHIWLAWGCELFGGFVIPLFNAQSSALFQQEAKRERLAQLSAVRLLMMRAAMPLGILFASSGYLHFTTRQSFAAAGTVILVPGLYFLLTSIRAGQEMAKRKTG
ncbi:Major Facilitator Superfamily protein [Fictibacillus solisalsi]|uniref:Major Facilitator Superfamily protein n=1 Tax=Fictibacillus solisalsi TaxID=459525 RepID=A0A1G9TZX0_9BACL|nr:MFS transporter [Fictibacillus solisalsi]SDM53178.1 Major Facilitator Superfamily protein [Fictibacillus solisalsi]